MKPPVLKAIIPAIFTFISTIAFFSPESSFAQFIASDNAGNYSSWPQTANNGFGFGNWSYNNTTPNGGFSGQFLGGSPSINSGNGNAWGFYANSAASAQAQAISPFSAGSLQASQTFSVQMQNGNITDNGGQVGFSLRDNAQNNVFQFYFNGGGSDYFINVWQNAGTGFQIDTGIGYSSGPMTLAFTQETGNQWSFTITEGNALVATLDSAGTGHALWENNISQAELYTLNGGSSRTLGDNSNLYFNNLEVVPEPSTTVLLGASLLIGSAFFRRGKK